MIEELRALIYATEFHPFSIKLKTGRVFQVNEREFAWVRPSGMVHVVDNDGRLYILAPKEIDFISAPEEANTEEGN
jgi:hypothetical protein